ncbi:MAG: hypothetical protein HPY61_11560 [Methanotrichaceae archaeon]|nr:hypothetical protein [Methanotrichaceae archaeon]
MQIAVVGGGICSQDWAKKARLLGRMLAEEGHVVICGGLGGVMQAVCRVAEKLFF